MGEQTLYWTKEKIREQLKVVRGEKAPTKLLVNGTYLDMALKKWMKGNIWICEDRIVYVGMDFPDDTEGTEIIDCSNQFIVPGYIEPHVHPFQLYNPETFAKYAAIRGTTTLICDSLIMALRMDRKKAFSIMEKLGNLPCSIYWWARYDSQTELLDEEIIFNTENVSEWINHPKVIQGGELTNWPKVLYGDDEMLEWMISTVQLGKKIEGHLPGASEKTLAQMSLLGVSGDHEAMTGEEVLRRLKLGYSTVLRYSSIRPDLPRLLDEIQEQNIDNYDRIFMTTDGSTPAFYKEGILDKTISIALEKGIPEIEAYAMASYNVARHYNLDHMLGMIAPGRVAHLNILIKKNETNPISVLAKGEWVKRDGLNCFPKCDFSWGEFGVTNQTISWDLSIDDFDFPLPVGIEMFNSVITKPYSIKEDQSLQNDEHYLMIIDCFGKWRVNVKMKGFAKNVTGLTSTYSSTGDIVIIGKNYSDMLASFNRAKELGGGIVLVENGNVIVEIPLELMGIVSLEPMEALIEKEERLTKELRRRGYRFDDAIYTILFLTAIHLPYIRITQKGVWDVRKRHVIHPSVKR